MSDLVKKLAQAKQLLDAGVLSETEYQRMREKHLAELGLSEDTEDSEASEAELSKPKEVEESSAAPKEVSASFTIDLFQGLNSSTAEDAAENVQERTDIATEIPPVDIQEDHTVQEEKDVVSEYDVDEESLEEELAIRPSPPEEDIVARVESPKPEPLQNKEKPAQRSSGTNVILILVVAAVFGVFVIFSMLGIWFFLGTEEPEVRAIAPKSEREMMAERLQELGITLVSFPAQSGIQLGSFYEEEGRDADESVTTASISSRFVISDTEITQGQYAAVMGSNPAQDGYRYWGRKPSHGESCANYGVGDTLPVHCVSWIDAIRFCNRLSVELGLAPVYTILQTQVLLDKNADGFRLPTEVEWVYAARGVSREQAFLSRYASSLCEYANVSNSGTEMRHPNWTRRGIISCEDSWDTLAPVGSQRSSRGLYDMTGNLWEWTWSAYTSSGPNTKFSSSVSLDSKVVMRGGAWAGPAADYRLANRYSQLPDRHSFFVGFRIVRNP